MHARYCEVIPFRIPAQNLARLMPADQMVAKLGGDSEAAARLSTDMGELRAVAASRPSFSERLTELDMSDPDYLAQAEERDDNALLVLPSG